MKRLTSEALALVCRIAALRGLGYLSLDLECTTSEFSCIGSTHYALRGSWLQLDLISHGTS